MINFVGKSVVLVDLTGGKKTYTNLNPSTCTVPDKFSPLTKFKF